MYTGVPRARFCLIEFIVSSSLTLYEAAANGGSPSPRSIELLASVETAKGGKSVRWHGKGKEKENLRVANLWEATVTEVSFLN